MLYVINIWNLYRKISKTGYYSQKLIVLVNSTTRHALNIRNLHFT